MAEGENRILKFRAYGPQGVQPGAASEVHAAVFANKLASLVRAIKAADAAVNGSVAHNYTIAQLHTSDPTALIREVRAPKFAGMFVPKSGIDAFSTCVEAVKINSPEAAAFGKCASHIAALARPTRFGLDYSAVWPDSEEDGGAIRLDSFLSDRARTATTPQVQDYARDWFKGSAVGTFDGSLDVVDARGALPLVKLTLSSGGKSIDCVCRAEHLQIIGASIKKRVRITGRAIYDGEQGLPIRVEVSDISPVKGAEDFTKWKGSFEPFDIEDWGDNS